MILTLLYHIENKEHLTMKTPKFEIIAGTYEEYLLGYYFIAKQSNLVQSFASHDHSSSIRSAAVSGQYLATGAADDRIIVYDLKSRKEHCLLTHHDATVNCLQFTSNHSHLLSGSADGVLAVVRVGNWQLEKVWEKAHKGAAIFDIAIHPSGKLALTLGADCSLRTWNLVKGRQAYIINLNSKSKDARSLNKIIWAEDGVRFILYGGKYTEIWSVETGGIEKVIEHDEKVSSCIWLSDNYIFVGYEDGQIASIEINKLAKNVQTAHAGRVKVLVKYNDWIISGSSNGEIKVWNRDLKELASHDCGCRITCLGIVPPVKVKKEEEDIIKEVVDHTTCNRVKKSIVTVEVECSDNEKEYIKKEINEKSKFPSKLKVKKKNRRLDNVSDETTVDGSQKKSKIIDKICNTKKRKNNINVEDVSNTYNDIQVRNKQKCVTSNKEFIIEVETHKIKKRKKQKLDISNESITKEKYK